MRIAAKARKERNKARAFLRSLRAFAAIHFPAILSEHKFIQMRELMRAALLTVIGYIANTGYSSETPAWVQKSNEAAKPLLDYIAKYNPESASSAGIDEADLAVGKKFIAP